MDLDPTLGETRGAHEGGERAHPLRACPTASWPPSSVHRRTSYTHIYLRDLKHPEHNIDREFRRQKPA